MIGDLHKEIKYFDWLGVTRFTEDVEKVKRPTFDIF